jgi:hypothetical protein
MALPLERFSKLLVALEIPQDHCAILTPKWVNVTSGCQNAAVWAEGHTKHPPSTRSLERFSKLLVALEIPQDHCTTAPGCQNPAVWAEGHTRYPIDLSLERFSKLLAALEVPQNHCAIIPECQNPAVWAEGDASCPLALSLERFSNLLAALEIPQDHCAILIPKGANIPPSCQNPAVWAEGHTGHPPITRSLERFSNLLAALEVPQNHSAIRGITPGCQHPAVWAEGHTRSNRQLDTPGNGGDDM